MEWLFEMKFLAHKNKDKINQTGKEISRKGNI